MEHSAKAGRKRVLRSAVDSSEKKVKEDSGVLLRSPLFGKSPKHDVSNVVGLARSPLFGGKSDKAVIPIGDLMVGSYRNASLIGRVTFIGDVVTWNNGRSEGKVASFGIVNQEKEISDSFFKEKVDEFYHFLEINKVVEIYGFRVKAIQEKFQKIIGQGLEIVLENTGSISESSEDIDAIGFNFKDILEINALTVGSFVDLMGIAYQAEELVEGISATGKDFAYKKLLFTDKTEMQYSLKVWGEQARTLVLEMPTVFVVRRGKLESYESEKYVSISGSSLLWVDPPIEEAAQLKDWVKTRLSQQ